MSSSPSPPPIDEIVNNFKLIDDGMERYEYLMELGRGMPKMSADLRTDENFVRGCESEVWIDVSLDGSKDEPRLHLVGYSSSFIVNGFVALMVALYEGRTPEEAATTDGFELLRELDFGSHITSKRSNGVRSMVARIQHDATRLAAA